MSTVPKAALEAFISTLSDSDAYLHCLHPKSTSHSNYNIMLCDGVSLLRHINTTVEHTFMVCFLVSSSVWGPASIFVTNAATPHAVRGALVAGLKELKKGLGLYTVTIKAA